MNPHRVYKTILVLGVFLDDSSLVISAEIYGNESDIRNCTGIFIVIIL